MNETQVAEAPQHDPQTMSEPSGQPLLDLPFWLSPWYVQRTSEGKLVHKIDVARSRKDRKRHKIVLSVPDDALKGVSIEDRRKMFAERLVQALQILGVCRPTQKAEAPTG